MNNKNIKRLIVTGFKSVTYVLLWLTFMIVMKRVNYALGAATRTTVITSSAFILMLLMMQHVYGNFEIGYKKSKPVFLSTMISVLFADFVAAVTMIIMGIVQFPIKTIIWPTFIHLIVIYILQGLLVWAMAHLGNDIYFKLYEPAKTVIINNDDFLYKKINRFVSSHDKQYKIIDEISTFSLSKLELINIDLIYALGISGDQLDQLILYCYRNKIQLVYNIKQTEVVSGHKNMFVIDDVLLIEIECKEISLFQLSLKRVVDIIGSLILLFISLPITIITAVAIKLDDGGPIFYSQERLTKDGKVFKIYKYRSMKQNAGDQPVQKDDDRITKVGHKIRKLRIDELPQVINILKGDISLVGPRPESRAHAEKIMKDVPDFELRLRVKAGLTGYAQIFGKYNTTPEMKLLLDLHYIENYSFIEDIKLILQTVMVFIRSDSTEAFGE